MKSVLFAIPYKYKLIIFCILLLLCILFPMETSPAWAFYVNAPVALAMGIGFALTIGNPFMHLNKKATTLLLQLSVVCLGFHLDINHALNAGKQGFIFTVCTICFTFIAGYIIGKLLKINNKTSFLISNGTAICGGSAIAAVAPIINANDNEMSVSLGTVFILNSLALIIFPAIGHFFHLSAEQFGTWCAIAIHDTSSVTGATANYKDSFGHEALQIATTIKLERALWIIPISFVTAWYKKSRGNIKIPYFIFFFVIAIIISNYFPIKYEIAGKTPYEFVFLFGRKGLIITLFLIGTGLSVNTIKHVGLRPVLQGILLWLLIGGISLFVISGLNAV